jgi:hypothetical protein
VNKSHRKAVVFASLVGVLMFTSALLMALAPAPLTPDATNSLFAVDAPSPSMEAIFQTQTPSSNTAWKYIYIHHSHTTESNPNGEPADHFVIGNGQGLSDGEVQMGERWEEQHSAAAPISICVVGDFDQNRPTPTQIRRLEQLVNALQAHYRIPLINVAIADKPHSTAGIGRFFPITALREQLIP